MSSPVKSAYLAVRNDKTFLFLEMEDGSQAECEIEKTGHRLIDFYRKHGLSIDKPATNTGQFIGQLFKA